MKDVRWRLHLGSPPSVVYRALATAEGRARWWAEEAVESDGVVAFKFPNGMHYDGKVLERIEGSKFSVDYFGSTATFEVEPDGQGGTDLTLTDCGLSDEDFIEVNAGWVSVLMSLKAYVDFGVDLRNHDPQRTWSQGFVDN